MKHILFLFSFLLVVLLMCYSCRREIAPTHSVLLTADSLMWSDPDSALLLLEQISEPQQLEGADCALYALLMTQARYKCCILLENDSLIQIAVKYYKKGNEKERLAKSYFYMGCVHVEKKELAEAIELYLKSLRLIQPKKDAIFVAMVYSHLGNCYNEQNLKHNAREMHKKCFEICAQKDSVRACYALNDIGDTFLDVNHLDSALYYYKQSLKIAQTLHNSDLLSIIYSDMAAVCKEQNNNFEAIDYVSNALAYSLSKEDYLLACSTKGDILDCLNNGDSAVYYWSIGATSSNIYVKSSSYNCLNREYKKRKDWEKATQYADSFFIYYDSIRTMNNRAELDKLLDNHLVELHKQKLSVRNQQITVCLIILFLFLAFTLIVLYLWRDGSRKKKFMVLQQRLMESRAKTLLLNEISEDTSIPNTKSGGLNELEEERIQISITLFRATQGYKKLNELEKATPKVRISSANIYRQIIANDIRKTFAYVMEDLKHYCPALTNDDLFYCILSLFQCSRDVIIDVMDVSADAIKTRKSRIKNKMDAELFNRVFRT
ncbi:tetratricopeptide repeat protein [Bacteroides sp.]|uniref:tetratricopeptide repeat protein n=1 Tax=Bacteroides sp. TaxID=29523 RepID=UPI00261F08D3|nr:tetratricopeptide repeat protein [Bacteroides sp.]